MINKNTTNFSNAFPCYGRQERMIQACEDILNAMPEGQVLRAMDIVKLIPNPDPNDWCPSDYKYTCQKVSAMLKKLRCMGLVERVLMEEKTITVMAERYVSGYALEDIVECNGQKFIREGARQLKGEWKEVPETITSKIYGFVKIGA